MSLDPYKDMEEQNLSLRHDNLIGKPKIDKPKEAGDTPESSE